MELEIKSDDFLTDNAHVYAIKAKRKKIAILKITATNRTPTGVLLILGSSKLTAHGKTYNVEQPEAVIRRLGEFTWDFLLYSIIDFHPVTTVIDATLFLTGPIYNRRLRRQLALLSAGDLQVPSGECRSALIAFRCVSKKLERLSVPVRNANGGDTLVDYDFKSSGLPEHLT
ncbi:MAG: hypothetical protein AB7I30_02670 [Isosphaeraceae bacterium]